MKKNTVLKKIRNILLAILGTAIIFGLIWLFFYLLVNIPLFILYFGEALVLLLCVIFLYRVIDGNDL
jgi:hypothetical protein